MVIYWELALVRMKWFAKIDIRRYRLYRVGFHAARAIPGLSSRWGKLAVVLCILALSCAIFIDPVHDSSLSEDQLVRENVLHRQSVAASGLDEEAFMLEIVTELGTGLKGDDPARVSRILVDQGRRYNLDPMLLVAVIMTESSFGPTEVSSMGARGLMQVKPSVAEAIANRNGIHWGHADQLFDPAYNIHLGTRYLFELILQFRDVRKALIAYNYGETALRGRLANGQKLPTRYLRRVKKNYYAMRDRFGDRVPWEPVQFELPIQ